MGALETYLSDLRDTRLSGEGTQNARLNDASTTHVLAYVRHRLQDVFPSESNAEVLWNSKGAPLFGLVLGVSSESHAAQEIARRIANHLVKNQGT
jgi:hypothetical protein